MKEKSENPFLISGYEGPALFCDREKEVEQLKEAVFNKRNVTLISPRRYGKTGLLYHFCHHLKKEKVKTIYLDIYGTTDLQSFIREFALQVLSHLVRGKDAMIKNAVALFSSIRPQFTFDELTGMPQMQINLQTEAEKEYTLGEIFKFLDNRKEKIVIAIDEFQQVNEFPEKNTEALLRSYIQHQKNVQYVFSGSRKHVLLPMFSDSRRPFYQSTQILLLDKLDKTTYGKFIAGHFKKAGRIVNSTALDYILEWSKRHTYYTQYLCNRLFSSGKKKIEIEDVKEVILKIFAEKEGLYYNYRKLLPPQQFKLLTAIGKAGTVTEPTGQEFMKKYDLSTPSTVRKSLLALIDKEMVYEEIVNDRIEYKVYDVFLSRWMEMKMI